MKLFKKGCGIAVVVLCLFLLVACNGKHNQIPLPETAARSSSVLADTGYASETASATSDQNGSMNLLDESQFIDPALRSIIPPEQTGKIPQLSLTPKQDSHAYYYYKPCETHLDLYPNACSDCVWHYNFLSERRMDLSSLSMLPNRIRSSFELSIAEKKLNKIPKVDPVNDTGGLSYDQYAMYRGTDWKELANLEQVAASMPENEAAQRNRDMLRDQWIADFCSLPDSAFPDYYLYTIQLRFIPDREGGAVFEEEIYSLEFEIFSLDGNPWSVGVSWDTPVVCLHPDKLDTLDDPGLQLSYPGYKVLTPPINNGNLSCKVIEFSSLSDLTLKKAALKQENTRIESIVIERNDNGVTTVTPWDGDSDLPIRAGETVTVYLSLHNAALENRITVFTDKNVIRSYDPKDAKEGDYIQVENDSIGQYQQQVFFSLAYEMNGETYCAETLLQFQRDYDPWEAYLINILFVDPISYYIDYYNPIYNTEGNCFPRNEHESKP